MGTPKISPTLFIDGAVGLRIVAAMSSKPVESARPAKLRPRSDPIPIRGRAAPTAKASKVEKEEEEDGDEEELSESYTCVISRAGGGTVRKRVYAEEVGVDGMGGKFEMNSGVFFDSPPPTAMGPTISGGFLSCCYLCRKKLHGLDIFMYRGDKAFCSVECRYQQILSDDRKEKCQSKLRQACDSPLSPYLASFPLDAGVAAA